jgi:ubiquinone/menaquinone biosynthesis C-methylase UbiE
VKDLGCVANVDVINQFVALEQQFVIDAGCGNMTFSRHLSDLGAKVLAIDPDPVQAEINRASEPIRNLEFVETGADRLPVASGAVDGVFFSYSLHHVPADLYPRVFEEVLRILKPSGFLYVIEPIDCPVNEVMKLFHNEDRERAAAWKALEQLADSTFTSMQVVKYHSYS